MRSVKPNPVWWLLRDALFHIEQFGLFKPFLVVGKFVRSFAVEIMVAHSLAAVHGVGAEHNALTIELRQCGHACEAIFINAEVTLIYLCLLYTSDADDE